MDSLDRGCHGLWCCAVRFTGVLCGISSDLRCMEQGELRRDQHTVLVQTVHIQSAGAAKPNTKTIGTSLVLKCGV